LNDFRQDGFIITGFSIVDYKNYQVVKQIGDTVQQNVQYNKIRPIPVLLFIIIVIILIQMNFNLYIYKV
jgi:hypothetical protein